MTRAARLLRLAVSDLGHDLGTVLTVWGAFARGGASVSDVIRNVRAKLPILGAELSSLNVAVRAYDLEAGDLPAADLADTRGRLLDMAARLRVDVAELQDMESEYGGLGYDRLASVLADVAEDVLRLARRHSEAGEG